MLEIKDGIMEKLKCSECDSYLSCAPIMIKSDGDPICGRCNISDDDEAIAVRNTTFEVIAKILAFPCRYRNEGCTKKLQWNEVKQHEENCDYRVYECPVLPQGSCSWLGTNSKLLDHYKKDHTNMVLDYPCKLQPDWSRDGEDNFLLMVFGFLFLVQIKLNASCGKLWHSVRYLGNNVFTPNFEYILELCNYDCVMLKTKPVLPRDTLAINRNNSIEINIKSVMEFLGGCEHVSMSITIKQKGNVCFRCRKDLDLKMRKYNCFEDGYFCLNCKTSRINSNRTIS